MKRRSLGSKSETNAVIIYKNVKKVRGTYRIETKTNILRLKRQIVIYKAFRRYPSHLVKTYWVMSTGT